MFNVFEQLFAPGRKHTDDEKKRLELSRVDVDDGDPGRGPIDLSSGKVVVRVPQQSTEEPHPAPNSSSPPASAPATAPDSSSTPTPTSAPAPAPDEAPPAA
ncbi:DUF6191 domain-containing protein [Streptomyces sp. NPDC053474]|uniref:DUF6191 domain-containing protein n=1 Tax=Streptomyces sp. NPDC053474 TaxID=3365704 RepID=UPI0037D6538C